MYYRLLILLVFSFVCLISHTPHRIDAAETDIEKKLFKEIVKVEDGKMTSTEYGLLSFPLLSDERTQYKLYAEAPADGVISRDNFIGITITMQAMILFQMAAVAHSEYAITCAEFTENPTEVFDIDELDEPIGKVDLEINFYMNKGGLQIEVVNTKNGTTNRNTMTWAEVFE